MRRKNINYLFWVCSCSFTDTTCIVNEPYFHLWPAWLYNIFHIISQNLRFFKIFTGHKICVLNFCTVYCDTFFVLRRTERNIIVNVHCQNFRTDQYPILFQALSPKPNRFLLLWSSWMFQCISSYVHHQISTFNWPITYLSNITNCLSIDCFVIAGNIIGLF